MVKKRTRIIATIHPKIKLNVLRNLVDQGANIIRINSKYVTIDQTKEVIRNLDKIKKGRLMVDIKNHKYLDKILDEKIKFDYLAVSFAEKDSEIKEIRKKVPKKVRIISKIETKKGVDNINKLIRVSDGIMVYQEQVMQLSRARAMIVATATMMEMGEEGEEEVEMVMTSRVSIGRRRVI